MKRITKLKNLIGKTIVDVKHLGFVDYADTPYLELKFSDGSICMIESSYGEYSRDALDEYVMEIFLTNNSRAELKKRGLEVKEL